MKKIITIFSVSLVIVFFSIIKTNAYINENTELNLETMTSNDTFEYENNNYNIRDYNSMLTLGNSFKENVLTLYYDNPIIHIIPKELFTFENITTYIGEEYGFFIKTIHEKKHDDQVTINTLNYRSNIIVFDVSKDLNLSQTIDKVKIKTEVLYCYEFIAINKNEDRIYIKNNAINDNYNDDVDYQHSVSLINNSRQEYTICPLYDKNGNAKSNKYYLNDISFGATLENIQDLNEYDYNYKAENDNGSYFSRIDYYYDGQTILRGSFENINFGEIGEIIKENLVETLISKIPVIGDVASEIYSLNGTFIDISNIIVDGLSNKYYDETNDKYSSIPLFTNKYDQISNYGNLMKCAFFSMNTTTPDCTIFFGENDYARIEYTINHSSNNTANYTRLNNEIALRIVDKDLNVVDVASCYNPYNIREEVNVSSNFGNSNDFYLLPKGLNYFAFQTDYTGVYELNFTNSQNLTVRFNNKVYTGENIKISEELHSGQEYKLILENNESNRELGRFEFNISNNTENITISPNDQYIISVDNETGFYNIKFENSNSISILSENLSTIRHSNSSNICTLIECSNYIVISNESENEIFGSLIFKKEFNEINENETIQFKNFTSLNFIEFVPKTTDSYFIFEFYNDNNNSIVILDDIHRHTTSQIYCDEYTIHQVRLIANTKYYIGYENEVFPDIKLLIENSNWKYKFYLNDNIVDGNIYLKQGDKFQINIYLGDEKIENYNFYSFSGLESSYIYKNGDFYFVDIDAPTSNAYCDRIIIKDIIGNNIEWINLVYVPKFTIDISTLTYENQNIPNKLCWNFESSNVFNSAKVYCELKFSDGTKHDFIFDIQSNQQTGIVDLPSISSIKTKYGKSKANAVCRIIKVEFKHHWTNNGNVTYDEYFHIMNNSYPFIPNQSLYEVSIPNFTINFMFNGGDGSAGNPYLIINEWQLNNIRYCDSEYRDGGDVYSYIQDSFKICNNISMTNEWTPIDLIKNGGIYGINANIQINSMSIIEQKDSKNVGFIRNLKDGYIKNLVFNNATINISNSNVNTFTSIGIIAGNANGSTISNCVIEKTSLINVGFIEDNTSVYGAKYTYTGGICGQGSSIINCTNRGTISSYGHIGGICGYAFGTNFNACTNYGFLTLLHNNVQLKNDNENRAIGGIAGIANGISFTNITNNGSIQYKSLGKSSDKTLSPRMGWHFGEISNYNGDINRENVSCDLIDTQNLQTKKILGFIVQYDQLKYTKLYYGKVN